MRNAQRRRHGLKVLTRFPRVQDFFFAPKADLAGADLRGAGELVDLRDANLENANLAGTDLGMPTDKSEPAWSQFENANQAVPIWKMPTWKMPIYAVPLEDATLESACLNGAQLDGAILNWLSSVCFGNWRFSCWCQPKPGHIGTRFFCMPICVEPIFETPPDRSDWSHADFRGADLSEAYILTDYGLPTEWGDLTELNVDVRNAI